MDEVPQNKLDERDDFRWLRRASRGPTYNSYSLFSHLPASSFDWGAGGYAGCSNNGGELLYLSAPSATEGLIMARGNFSTSLYASLSRAQIEFGGPSTFGFEVSRAEHEYDPDAREEDPKKMGSSFWLGAMVERGCFNYRWPLNEYYLDLYDREAIEQNKEKHVGTCQMFSCVKDSIFYQVLRIEEGGHIDKESDSDPDLCRHFPARPQIVLTMGGPVWFQSFKDRLHDHVLTERGQLQTNSGHECNMNSEIDEVSDVSPEGKSEGKFDTIRYWNKGRKIGLEARVWQLQLIEGKYEYIQLELVRSKAAADIGPAAIQGDSRVPAYNAVRQLQQLSDPERVHKEHRSATFLAQIRLYEGDENGGGEWPKHLTSQEIYNYVGVSPSSPDAAGAMWETVFIERRSRPDSITDLAEVSLVGRSLEKILQVDITPAAFRDMGGVQDQAGIQKQTAAAAETQTTALVSNLFTRPNIDLKALFWKVRFLCRTYKFLSCLRKLYKEANPNGSKARHNDSEMVAHTHSPKTDVEDMVNIARSQLTRIQRHIENVVRYLVRALLEPGLSTPMMPDSHIPGESNYFYVMTTIWYVIKSFPDWSWDWKESIKKWKKEDCHLFDSSRLPRENWTFGRADKDKIPLLQWYHHGSILKLFQEGILPNTWQDDHLDRKVFRLAKAAKVASAAKLSSRQPYVAEDEIIDRLSFLSDELGLEHLEHGRIGAIALLSMKRVKRRDLTRNLSPGWLPRPEEGSTSGPWEIYALSHHSRLVVLSLEEKDSKDWRTKVHAREEAEVYKGKIGRFLNAEGTLVPCWDRSYAKVREGWLSSENTAVLATTILTIQEEQMKDGLPGVETTDTKGDSGDAESMKQVRAAQDHQEQRKLLTEITYMESLMKDQLEVFEKSTGEARRLRPIQWITFSPPRRYHPESFTNSLEDTPELYRPPLINKFSVPVSLRNYATLSDEMNHEFGMKDLTNSILKSLWLWDIKATVQDEDASGFTWEVKPLTYDTPGQNKEKEGSLLRWALYDSLVDQEVQHRFLIVRNVNPPKYLLNLLIYVLHNESAACLGNHVLRYSRFSCQSRDTWVASITLRCWRVSNDGPGARQAAVTQEKSSRQENVTTNPTASGKQSNSSSQQSTDDEPICLPRSLKDVWSPGQREELRFVLEMASIVISTNAFGDFSKCTIVSELIEEYDMEIIVENARKLWQKFIHQPQTARCLVFFLVLGKICQQLTKSYEDSIDELTSTLKLDTIFTRSDERWSEDRTSALEFEMGLWSLESLHRLQDSLMSSVSSILEAKETLLTQINHGPGNRGEALERMCQEYLGEFENSFVELTAVNARLEQKVKLNTRYKEAFSAVLTMRDSRASLKQNDISLSQNSTIQKLTYLTIVYLPVALMAAIFAIPTEQRVIFASTGIGWFVGGIVLLSAATYTIAIYIDKILVIINHIIDFIKYPPPKPQEKPQHYEPETPSLDPGSSYTPPNIWRWLSKVLP